jgi:hypothetical protein
MTPTTLTVLADDARPVEAELVDGTAQIAPDDLGAATGWDLKPEGLCQGPVCVPVPDQPRLFRGDRVDLAAVAEALDRPFVLDPEAGVAALGEPRAARRLARESLQAPPFTLPDLDGDLRSLDQWRGRKKLLIAFASW